MFPYRFLIYHKQGTSGKTLFLQYANGSILGPEPVPALSQKTHNQRGMFEPEDATVAGDAARKLSMPADSFEINPDFVSVVETPETCLNIVLVSLTTLDPPHDLVAKAEAKFIGIMQARGLPDVELELLRTAYESILGG